MSLIVYLDLVWLIWTVLSNDVRKYHARTFNCCLMGWIWIVIRLWYVLKVWDQLLNKIYLYTWLIEELFLNEGELFWLRNDFEKYRDEWFW